LAELRIDDQLREEEQERWRQEWARRQSLEEKKNEELDRLKETEELAERWRRATALREYASAMERGAKVLTAAPNDRIHASDVAWIRNAADWLDPLTQKHWPDVDLDERM
jgi:hypothetical protein